MKARQRYYVAEFLSWHVFLPSIELDGKTWTAPAGEDGTAVLACEGQPALFYSRADAELAAEHAAARGQRVGARLATRTECDRGYRIDRGEVSMLQRGAGLGVVEAPA